jgi:hypothetical protein
MTKADYIHLFKEACGGKCNAEYNPCAFLQAANKLLALKPVAYKSCHNILYHKKLRESLNPISLYALDEANNEDASLS